MNKKMKHMKTNTLPSNNLNKYTNQPTIKMVMKNLFANWTKFQSETLPAVRMLMITMLFFLFSLLSISQRTFKPAGADIVYAVPASVSPVFTNAWRTQIISLGKGANSVAKWVDTLCPVPDLTNLPDFTGECSVTISVFPTATIHGGEIVIGVTSDPLNYSAQGSYIIHWKYDNGNGHLSLQNQYVIVQDTSAPVPDVVNLPDVIGECSASVTAPTATDNCSGVITATTSDPLTYTEQEAYIIHWIYNDGNGNTSSQDQNVIVKDVSAPVPDMANLPDVTGECSASVLEPTATDNCSGVITATTSDLLTYTTQGAYIIHWIYNDGNGNTSSQDQNVIVKDVSVPVPDMANLPDVTSECSATVTAPTATDNCSGVITATTSDPLTYTAQEAYVIHWVYNDGNGNTSSQDQNVIVKDVTAPVPDIANLPDVNSDTIVTVAAPTATDNCSGVVTASTSNPVTFTAPGTYIIHWTYDDGNGNRSSQNQNVIVQDVTPPAAHYPSLPDVTSECSVSVIPPTAFDNLAGVITASTSDPQTYSAQGTYIIHWIYDDGNGNISSQNQNVIVKDVTAPVPNVANLPNVNSEYSVTVTAPTATDNCAGLVTATTSDPLSASVQGSYIIHWTYDDSNGNIFVQNQNVVVKDLSAPVPAVANLPTITGECSATAIPPIANDNVEGIITGITSDPMTYSAQGTYTIHWIYDDGNGNTASQDQNVIVQDVSAPTFTPLSNVVSCNGSVSSIAPQNVSDNCSSNVTITYGLSGATTATGVNDASHELFNPGTTTVKYTLTDGNGNSSQFSFDVNYSVIDVSVSVNQNILSANGTGTYQWVDCSNQMQIANATSQSFTASNIGAYSVLVSNNGCSASSQCIEISLTGTQEYLNANLTSIAVYPNPTNGIINITSNVENAGMYFSLLDVSGKEVYAHSDLNNKSNQIDMEKLSQGLYFMKIFNGGEERVIKVIKQ